jgi:hypothetical protein
VPLLAQRVSGRRRGAIRGDRESRYSNTEGGLVVRCTLQAEAEAAVQRGETLPERGLATRGPASVTKPDKSRCTSAHDVGWMLPEGHTAETECSLGFRTAPSVACSNGSLLFRADIVHRNIQIHVAATPIFSLPLRMLQVPSSGIWQIALSSPGHPVSFAE